MLDEKAFYRTAATLSFRDVGEDQVKIMNTMYGSGFTGPQAILEILRFSEEPKSLEQLRCEFEGTEDDVFELLIRESLIIDEASYRRLTPGLMRGVSNNVGVARAPHELSRTSALPGFAIIGAGTDVATLGLPGARFGPELVRGAAMFRFGGELPVSDGEEVAADVVRTTHVLDLERRRRVDVSSIEVVDLGDVVKVGGEPMADYGFRLSRVTRMALEAGYTPIVIGGDHSISRYPLEVFAQRHTETGFGIIHFDAHHDLYPSFGDEVTHANPFREVMKTSSVRYLFQVGLRMIEPLRDPAAFRCDVDDRIQYVSALELSELKAAEVFAKLPRDLPCYLTFDVDCMSPTICPETGTPTAGGLSYYQAFRLIEHVASTFHCVGADFVEVAASPAKYNAAAVTVMSLISRFLLAHAKSEPLSTYVQTRLPDPRVPAPR